MSFKNYINKVVSVLVDLEAYAGREQNGRKALEDGKTLAKIRKK